MPGKFDCPRDEVLNTMVTEAWSNESFGSVQESTGFVALICNEEDEMKEIREAFEESAPEGFDWQTAIGNFILTENDQGFVSVEEFETGRAAQLEYSEREKEYNDSYTEEEF